MPEPRKSDLKFLSVSNAIRGEEGRRRPSGHSVIARTLLLIIAVSALVALVRGH